MQLHFPAALTLLLLSSSAYAQCPQDDTLGNNTFNTAVILPQGESSFEGAVVGIGGGSLDDPNVGNDYFRAWLEPGQSVRIAASQVGSAGAMRLERGPIGSISQTSLPDPGLGAVFYMTNDGGLGQFYLVRLIGDAPGCAEYRLDAILGNCPGDDLFTSNSACVAATPLSSLTTSTLLELSVQGGNDDWFDLSLDPGASLDLEILFRHSRADIDLDLYDADGPGCGTLVDSSASTTNGEDVAYTNSTSAVKDLRVRVHWYGGNNLCNDYRIAYTIDTPSFPDDHFEDNDSFCQAVPAPLGVTTGLIVRDGDSDFYRLDVPAFVSVVCALDFENALGDIDLALWEDLGDCANPLFIDDSQSTSDYEEVRIPASNAPATYLVRVLYYPSDGGSNEYTMTIAETTSAGLGAIVCEGVPNTTGVPGKMRVTGSVQVQSNSSTLHAFDLPANVFGFFNGSEQPGFVANPGGSEGNLCIAGGFIARFVGPGQIMNTGSAGVAELTPDLGAVPGPTGTRSIAAGDTWYFQFWHRDVIGGSQSSNFTGALRVRFE